MKKKVRLIEIPYDIEYIKLIIYIYDQLKNNNIIIKKKIKSYKFLQVLSKKINELNDLAKKRGGECLSTVYLGNNTKLKWECGCGHSWSAVPDSIKRGTWCPICAGNIRLTIKDMQELAEKKEGKCLSTKYLGNKTKLWWECGKGHPWESMPKLIRMGHWCPKCSYSLRAEKLRDNINNMQELAEKKGGKCLSTKYYNNRTKLKWECGKGHTWSAVPGSIKRGTWCPICAGNK